MKARQKNIVFPDTVVNGRRVEELIKARQMPRLLSELAWGCSAWAS
jgi:hypothetical protein